MNTIIANEKCRYFILFQRYFIFIIIFILFHTIDMQKYL